MNKWPAYGATFVCWPEILKSPGVYLFPVCFHWLLGTILACLLERSPYFILCLICSLKIIRDCLQWFGKIIDATRETRNLLAKSGQHCSTVSALLPHNTHSFSSVSFHNPKLSDLHMLQKGNVWVMTKADVTCCAIGIEIEQTLLHPWDWPDIHAHLEYKLGSISFLRVYKTRIMAGFINYSFYLITKSKYTKNYVIVFQQNYLWTHLWISYNFNVSYHATLIFKKNSQLSKNVKITG